MRHLTLHFPKLFSIREKQVYERITHFKAMQFVRFSDMVPNNSGYS